MNQELRGKLSRIADILRAAGVVNPITCIEQISYLIYLKLLDEKESGRELESRLLGKQTNSSLLFTKQAERYRWSKWRFKGGEDLRNFVRDEVFPYMASPVKDEPRIADYFRDAVLEIADPNILKQVVDEIDGIEFSKLEFASKGDIFEYLLAHPSHSDLTGQFRTPRHIRAMMVEMTDPDFGDTIYDPACGTGGFLVDAVDYILAKYSNAPIEVPIYGDEWLERHCQSLAEAKKTFPALQTYRKGEGEKIPDWNQLERSIYGIDVSRRMIRITMMNLVLHGIRNASVKRANALSEMAGLAEDDLDLARKYKVILSNPPFAGGLSRDSISKDLPTSPKKSALLFLGMIMEALAPGGRCAVIVPEWLLIGSIAARVAVRRKLVEEYEIMAVVSLPTGVFKPCPSAKTAILVFQKPVANPPEKKPAEKKTKIWFYDARADGYDQDNIRGGARLETPASNDIPDILRQWAEYRKSGFKNPPGAEACAVLDSGEEDPRCWWALIDSVRANDYNLAAVRYKPVMGASAPREDPAELIKELLDEERKIIVGLDSLLADIEKLK